MHPIPGGFSSRQLNRWWDYWSAPCNKHRGVLDVDAPVSLYVPEIADIMYRTATVRHLLDMRTGVFFDEVRRRAYFSAADWDQLPCADAPRGLHDFFTGLPRVSAVHGGPFRYFSANIDLLGWVIERASGQTFMSAMSSLLWRPLAAESAAHIMVDRHGTPRCTGGLCATVRDLARVGQLMVDGGRSGSLEVIPGA
jgi:CubicO group peptidase (beta-lactamase class C family)